MDYVVDTEFFADPVAAAKAAMDNNNSDDYNNINNDVEDGVENDSGANDNVDNNVDDGVVDEDNDNDNIIGEDNYPVDDDEEDDDDGANYLENSRVKLEEETNDYRRENGEDDVDDVMITQQRTQQQQQQQQQPQQQAQVDDESTKAGTTTVINGKGIWHSWTRNFATPLLALLDLLDNAFDAISLTYPGRIFILPDLCKDPLQQQAHSQGTGGGKPKTTGLTLWNNSITPIKPLSKVLEVYTSLKGSSANSIGENGVGLKQGCATLSNLSFCIVKSNGNQYSLGIIAYQLQTDYGCSLPSFTFDSANLKDLRDEMIDKFANDDNNNNSNAAAGDCLAQYGSLTGSVPASSDRKRALHLGIDRIIEKFQYVTFQNGWDKYPHVFGLVVDHLKHGEKNTNNNSSNSNSISNNNPTRTSSASSPSSSTQSTVDQPFRVNKTLETLYQDLPKRYLHIPRTVDVRVGGKVVNFNFWQPRLVEMAQFDLKINRTANLIDVFNVGRPTTGKNGDNDSITNNDQVNNSNVMDLDNNSNRNVIIPPNDDYTLRIYTGFDALRVCDDRAPKTASMYMYSRHSGRLIKANMDCRGELGLTSGGTDFCQGLTVIVDDYNANFPLNPTKQDVAFGEQSSGETHKRNLYVWLNAAARLYYMFYKDRVCNKQKRILTESLKRIEPQVRQLILQSATSFQSLSDCQFTTFGDFTSHYLMNSGQSIRLLPFRSIEYFLGKDSRLQLPPVPEHDLDENKPNKTKPGPKSKAKTTTPGGRASVESTRSYNSASIYDDDNVLKNENIQISNGGGRNNYRDDDDDETIDDNELYVSKHQLRRKRFISSKETSTKRPDSSDILSNTTPRKIESSNIANSNNNMASKKRTRQGSLERIGSMESTNYEHDLQFMTERISALENENKLLKKDMKHTRSEHISEMAKKEQIIETLKESKTELRMELVNTNNQAKVLRQQVKELIRSGSSANHSIVSQLDDMSGSRLSSGDAAKAAKRLKNLKSNLDVLKSENDDLKEQIKSLESTIARKDKTIQAQRRLIDQRNLEDEEDSINSDDDDDVVDIHSNIRRQSNHKNDHISINSEDDIDDDSSI
jgi:hypothetical protein